MFKQGYLLQVTSWENDADFYNTKTIEGLSKEQATWLVRFCELIAKLARNDAETCNTNLVAVAAAIDVPYAGFPGWDEDDVKSQEDVQARLQDLVYELVGPDCEYTGRMRVCDSWKVCFIPFDIPEIKF